MARQYANIVSFVGPHGYVLKTGEEEYKGMEKKEVCFVCPAGHEMTLQHPVYINKKSKFLREKLSMEEFCSVCVSERNRGDSVDKFIEKIEKKGHLVLEVEHRTRKVVYQCGNCGERCNSYIQNMLVNTGVCHHCQNVQFRVSHEEVKRRVEEKGFELKMEDGEYETNKKVMVECPCGKVHPMQLSDIKKGKRCPDCRIQRMKQTCMERYGEDNPSKVPEIYERIVERLFSRKKFVFPSGREVTVMGYEPQAIERLLAQERDLVLDRKIEEDEIRVGREVPRFRYRMDGDHVYFPDMWIRDTKVIIEVKSDYTFSFHPMLNYEKGKAVVEAGYVFRLMIFDRQMALREWIFRTAEECEEIKSKLFSG
jgi:hypothetical protein